MISYSQSSPFTDILNMSEYNKLKKGELEALCEEKFAKGIILITYDEADNLEESTRQCYSFQVFLRLLSSILHQHLLLANNGEVQCIWVCTSSAVENKQ